MDNAAQIFEAAESASRSGHSLSEMTILITEGGGIRMIADSDWPLESLQVHHGAQMAYRVTGNRQSVQVEGRSAGRKCVFQSETPRQVARLLLGATPVHVLPGAL